MDEDCIERELKRKGLTGPRLHPADIDDLITWEDYHVFPTTCVTVCCLTLRNGYHVIGYHCPIAPENYDFQIGRDIARAHAREQIWTVEGYLLKQRLWEQATAKDVHVD